MRSWLRTLILTGLMLVLVGVFLRNAHLDQVARVVRTAHLGLVAAGVVCVFASYALRAVRWQVMLLPLGRTHFVPAFTTTTVGFAASFVLPARAGEIIRPWLLARREGFDPAAVFATVVIERMLDLVAVLLLLGLFFLLFDPGLASIDPAMYGAVRAGGLAAAAASVAGMGILMAFAARPDLFTRAVGVLTAWLPARLGGAVRGLASAFGKGLAVVRDPGPLGWSLAWSMVLWIVIAAQIWMVSIGTGVALPWSGAVLVMALLVVGVAVPTPGAVGGFHEAYRIGVTSFFGADNDHAVGAAIVLHAVGFVPTLIAGGWLMAREGLSLTHLGAAVARAKDEETRR
jgi:hypothetical protein